MDADVQAYIDAVIAVDGFMWPHVQEAANAFVLGCKADASMFAGLSNWDAMLCAGLMCGPYSRAAASIPLKGSPTFVGFSTATYDILEGIKGSGSSIINTGVLNQSLSRENVSFGCWISEIHGTVTRVYIGNTGDVVSGASHIRRPNTATAVQLRSQSLLQVTSIFDSPGYFGISRSSDSTVSYAAGDDGGTVSLESQNPLSGEYHVFGTPGAIGNARIAFFHVGHAIDPFAMRSRLVAYMTDLRASATKRGFPMSRLVN